ncbi:MAG TPA: hypothetical protein VK774_10530 [Solirubrobacteraceae bacterium]|jgi:hypothetical protein|nr:hypothetical protein [Solirubrobacteraceae bacterium]
MALLNFTADGRLTSNARSLSSVSEAEGDASVKLLAGDATCEIVPRASSGWAFDLRKDDGSSGGGFRPFRLRRGGRLRVGTAAVSLHGRPSSHVGWSFSTPDGRRIDATVATDATAVGDEPDLFVELQTQEPLDAVLELADVLALGCWLIVRWHSAPSTDHLLSAAAPSLGISSGSWQAAVAGIS